MKKIAIITNGLLPVPNVKSGGAETLVQNLIDENEINKLVEFKVYSIYDEEALIKSKKYSYSTFKFLHRKPQKISRIMSKIKYRLTKTITYNSDYSIDEICNDLKKDTFDVILVENTLAPIEKIKKKINIPIYIHIHNHFYNEDYTDKNINRVSNILNKCDGIIVVSEYIKKYILKGLKVNEEKITVVKNCTGLFCNDKLDNNISNNLRKKYNLKDSDIIILYTGRVCYNKGVLELVKAYCNLKNRENLKLMIVGGVNSSNLKDRYFNDIEIYANKNPDIIITGYQSPGIMRYFYDISDIMIVPSIGEDAGPLTILEAMVSGLPIIASDSGGIPEYVTDENSFIVNRGNDFIENLTSKIEKLINSKNIRSKMSNSSKKLVSVYNTENYYKCILSCIMDTRNS